MSNFRVSKIKSGQEKAIKTTDFENLHDAESHAQKESLYDNNHFYMVERKIDEDEYEGITIFTSGQRGADINEE